MISAPVVPDMELVRNSEGADLMQRSTGVITAQPRGTGPLTGEEPAVPTAPTAPELEENEDDR